MDPRRSPFRANFGGNFYPDGTDADSALVEIQLCIASFSETGLRFDLVRDGSSSALHRDTNENARWGGSKSFKLA